MTDAPETRDLRSVRREQATERRRLKEQRQRAVERLNENATKNASQTAERVRRHNAVVTGMVPRIAGAVDSWAAKRVPMSVEHPARAFHASTDFRSIHIAIPATETVDLDFAADLRGLAYHEAGHILKSVPYPVMIDAVLPLDEGATQRDRDQYIQKLTQLSQSELHHAWNMLEDQRMESAMVRESVNLGRYYNVIVLEHVLQAGVTDTAFLLLYGRQHVDPAVRNAAWRSFVATHGAPKAEEAENLIDTYKRSNDPHEMWACVVRFGKLVGSVGGGKGLDSIDGHEYYDGESPGEGAISDKLDDSAEPEPTPGDPSENEGDQPGEGESPDKGDKADKGKGGGSKDADEDDDEDAVGEAGDSADRLAHGEDQPRDGQGASKSVNDPDWSRDLVKDAIEEAKRERNADGNVLNDVKAYNLALQDAKSSLPIARIPYTVDPDPQVTNEAVKLNRGLRSLMEQAREEAAPTWQLQQRRGVLDIRSYITRQPGDMEYYRDYAPGGDLRLPDMAVSVVLDGSGSMDHAAQALAIAAFGIKSACDVIGVPCTVTVYDTDAYLLWDAEDRPLEVPYNIVPSGGTEPKRALDLLDLQKHDKKNHLVIIMTDGGWSGEWRRHLSLAHYAAPDRDIVMFYYQCPTAYGPQGMETCSLVQQIDDLQDMPRFLQRYLLRAM